MYSSKNIIFLGFDYVHTCVLALLRTHIASALMMYYNRSSFGVLKMHSQLILAIKTRPTEWYPLIVYTCADEIKPVLHQELVVK